MAMAAVGVRTLISLVQSRGRARCDDSRVVILLSERMWDRKDELERRERLMKVVLSMSCNSAPSAQTRERIREIRKQLTTEEADTDSLPPNFHALEGGEGKDDLVVRLVCFGAVCDAARLAEALRASLENSAMGLRVSLTPEFQTHVHVEDFLIFHGAFFFSSMCACVCICR